MIDVDRFNIQARVIHAARTDRRRKVRGHKPQAYGSAMPAYVHSFADMNGWRKEKGDQLKPEDHDRYGEHRKEQLDPRQDIVSRQDITDLEEVETWIAEFVSSESERRCLWKWAHAKVGGCHFNAWCFQEEGVHPETGRRRKNRAISQIEVGVARKLSQDKDIAGLRVLLDSARNAYVEPTLEHVGAQKAPVDQPFRDASFAPVHNAEFTWRDELRQRERERYKRLEAQRQKIENERAA